MGARPTTASRSAAAFLAVGNKSTNRREVSKSLIRASQSQTATSAAAGGGVKGVSRVVPEFISEYTVVWISETEPAWKNWTEKGKQRASQAMMSSRTKAEEMFKLAYTAELRELADLETEIDRLEQSTGDVNATGGGALHAKQSAARQDLTHVHLSAA